MREYDFEFVQTVCTNWLYTKDLLNEEDAKKQVPAMEIVYCYNEGNMR